MSLRLLVVAMLLTTAAALGMIAYRAAQPPVTITVPRAEALAPATPAVAPPVMAEYLVAARALPAGSLARDDDFKLKSVPPRDVPGDAILAGPEVLAGIRGALIRKYLDANATITIADILRPRDRGFLAAVLAPGSRAVSVGVDAISGVAGLIWPGDRVDVILTQEMDQASAPLAHRVMSETVLTDARVIAVDQEIVQGASGTNGVAGKVARTVTLQVTQDQAARLTVAQRLGHIALAIRAIVDATDEQVTRKTVFGSDVSPALSSAGAVPGSNVQVIQGDKVTSVTFQ
jgi:pilus assembly protein CpaB